jgi:1,4-alpha-glucan branching enzyme
MEHPFFGSWGYQVVGFFAPSSRFGTPDDFPLLRRSVPPARARRDLDWVPGHFPKDGTACALRRHGALRARGSARGEHREWGTLVFNYGRDEVRTFLLSNALYWLEEFHADGLRVDAVASMLYLDYSRREGEWLPNEHGGRENLEAVEFLKQLNIVTHGRQPGTITWPRSPRRGRP